VDTGTDKNNLDWLNPDVLMEFIDELREAGYKIGIPQYIAAQDLILILIAQGENLDNPEKLRNLLGPIFCSSPIEQEEFQQRFERWVKLFSNAKISTKKIDVEAEELSDELETERALSQYLTLLIPITIFTSIILFSHPIEKGSFIEPRPTPTAPIPKQTVPIPTPTGPLPTVPPRQVKTETSTKPSPSLPFNWRIQLFLLIVYVLIFVVWRLWWLWRANLFLQRHSTTQKPDLQTISITGFEENLFPSLVLLKIARSLRHRIRVPSREIDVNKTIDATLSRGGWLTPVYQTYQVLPEYLFLINRSSYRDHQAKFIEEIIEGLKQEGVFISIYFFDDDPRICFANDDKSYPFRLREIISKYSEHSLVIISDTEKFFSSISGELEPWVNQLTNWENRAVLTPTPVENWGYQELELAQEFIILPATLKGLEALSQRLRQGWATYFVGEETRIPLPDSLHTRPYLWIERNPPPTEQINAMLDSLEKYLGKNSFYWLSACAVFPELHWNMTIYLGNVLKIESGESLIEVCSLTDLARLPWLRCGYIPDWLRVYLITTLTQEQQQIIRTALQDLLITAVQGSVSKFQLEVATQYHRLLPKLANPILYLLSKKAAVDSKLRDYIFLGFMRGQSVLAMRVSDEFSRLLQKQKRYAWWRKVLSKLGIVVKPPIQEPSFAKLGNSSSSLINRRQFLKWLGWGVGGLVISVVADQMTKNTNTNTNTNSISNTLPDSSPTPLKSFEFEIVRVNAQGSITNRATRTAQSFMEDLGNGVNLEMVAIPGGDFMMGSPSGEKGRNSSESPQHPVAVPGFFMGKYEVTQAQYRAIMGNNPAYFKGDNRPVEQVSWNDAVEFCQKLSKITGRNYRLPSEAEWEYACRAATNTPFHFGETITADLANYDATNTYASEPKGRYRQQTTPVGTFKNPNAFGLYDMHGNVWEWCQDHWHENYNNGAPGDGRAWVNENDNQSPRLLRGGSWLNLPAYCRCAFRLSDFPVNRDNSLGFRVVCAGAVARTLPSP
jgi:formylglycine-generating enzyme required for sulfatase activity